MKHKLIFYKNRLVYFGFFKKPNTTTSVMPIALPAISVSPMCWLFPNNNWVVDGGGVGVGLGKGVLVGIAVRVGCMIVGWGVKGAMVEVGSRVAVAIVPRLISKN